MGKKLLFIFSFFLITPVFLFTLIFYQLYLFHQNSQNSAKTLSFHDGLSYGIISERSEGTAVALSPHEARIDVLTEFFSRYDSPLKEYSRNIVEAADKYGLDYRLLPAIAMQESTLCLRMPKGTNNCWGFGIYGKKRTSFDNLAQAIETVSKTLARDYHGKGLVDPAQIVTRYTPGNTNSWAQNVSYVMDRIGQAL